jgi:HAE1 family hydrophobic/amphiphilic exporter-1
MLPLALKFEEGAESRAPMAVVLLGGLVTSTLLTLVLVPVMYTYLDDLSGLPALARANVPRWLRLRRWVGDGRIAGTDEPPDVAAP